MSRITIALAVALAIGALALATVRVDTDARALLGADAVTASALDTPEGRALTLAILLPDRDRRSAIAHELAAILANDPMVGRVTLSPAPSEEMIDWLWLHRFALAPPRAEAFTSTALSAELRRARHALTDAADAPLAGRYLLDPTGSFRTLVERLRAPRQALPVYDGVPQARDDGAALVFIELADRPFDTAAQAAFDDRFRSLVKARGAEPLLVGPRSISAAVGGDIAERSTISAMVAGALLLLWLAAALRSARGILASVVPAALGTAVAALAIQIAFGRVHVLALGFGGALMGLALDYPMHLMTHPYGPGGAHARRCVRIGAATTAIAFLALIVAGIPAITQTGVFVASGLAVAAGAALWVRADIPQVRARPAPAVPDLRIRYKLAGLVAIAAAGAIGVALLPDKGAERLAALPPALRTAIDRLDRMIDLPSGRLRVEVAGVSLAEVLERQTRLAKVLEMARENGQLGRFEMLTELLPPRPEDVSPPTAKRLSEIVAGPLAQTAMRPEFRADIVEAYRVALAGRIVGPSDLGIGDLAVVRSFVRREGDLLRAPVMLWDVSDPAALAAAVGALHDPAIRYVDRGAEIARGFDRLTDRVRISVVIGAAAALGCLFAAVRRPGAVAEIVAGCVAATLATACIAGLAGGGLGVFHVMALALVVGIGIDYGLLLTLSGDDAQFGAAIRSVLLCATTTLIAFIAMAFSGVGVLEDIGTTVAIGVLAMLAVSLVQSCRATPAR